MRYEVRPSRHLITLYLLIVVSPTCSRPPYKTYRGNFNYYPMKIGDHVHIGANSIVEAATIGNHVEIGKNCIIVSPRPSQGVMLWNVSGK